MVITVLVVMTEVLTVLVGGGKNWVQTGREFWHLNVAASDGQVIRCLLDNDEIDDEGYESGLGFQPFIHLGNWCLGPPQTSLMSRVTYDW